MTHILSHYHKKKKQNIKLWWRHDYIIILTSWNEKDGCEHSVFHVFSQQFWLKNIS